MFRRPILCSLVLFSACRSTSNSESAQKDIVGERQAQCGAGSPIRVGEALEAEISEVTDSKVCAIVSQKNELCLAKVSPAESCESSGIKFVRACSLASGDLCLSKLHWWYRGEVAWVHERKTVKSICLASDQHCTFDLSGQYPKINLKNVAYKCSWNANSLSTSNPQLGFLTIENSFISGESGNFYINPTTLAKASAPPYGTKEEIDLLISELQKKGVCE